MKIYCTGCEQDVDARLTNGAEVYPHRPDLADYPFWHCDTCGNWVGCHHKTGTPTKPLGVIPTKKLKQWRQVIHAQLDPMWKEGNWNRKNLYAHLNIKLGYNYNTAQIKSVDEAQKVLEAIKQLKLEVTPERNR